jgi:GntR family transcriptional regulator
MTDDIVQPLKPNRVSLATQAQQYLLHLIEDGAYQPGEQLPSETDLAAQLGISRATLRAALQNLEQEGIVLRRHGVGTFVAPGFEGRLESGLERLESILELAGRQGMRLTYDDLRVDVVPADGEISDSLQLAPGLPVTRIRRVICADGRPVAYMEDLVPASVLGPDALDGEFSGSVLDLLREQRARQLGQAVADIVALNVDPILAKRLAVEPGRAVLLLREVLFDAEGRALDCSRNYFVPEFFHFHLVRTR